MLLVLLALAGALAYLGWSAWRTWAGRGKGCGGGCACPGGKGKAAPAGGLVSVEELTERAQRGRKGKA
jgi:hypothetical protein